MANVTFSAPTLSKDITVYAVAGDNKTLLGVAKANNINVSKEDLDKEIESIKSAYAGDDKILANLKRPEVLDTIAATVQNRKVVEYLKTKIAPTS